jgi:hypothetical protein
MNVLPSFQELLNNYPHKLDVPAKELLDQIGGQVRSMLNDSVNTCALRISYALNHCPCA